MRFIRKEATIVSELCLLYARILANPQGGLGIRHKPRVLSLGRHAPFCLSRL